MTHTMALSLAVTALATLGIKSVYGASSLLTVSHAAGEVVILPEPQGAGGELIMKIVALNRTHRGRSFGPSDIRITTASGTPIPLLDLASLIARTRRAATTGRDRKPYPFAPCGGPTVTYSRSGQPNLQIFARSDTLQTQIPAPRSRIGLRRHSVQRQIANLEGSILQPMRIAPGQVRGGEVVTRPCHFGPHDQHTVHVVVTFAGMRYAFAFRAPGPR